MIEGFVAVREKTGKTLAKEWRVPILFQMTPEANYSEIKAPWQLNATKRTTTKPLLASVFLA